METRKIPLFKPTTGDAEADAVRDVLKSGWVGNGPRVAEFEEMFASIHFAKYAIAVNSCTSALHLALLSLGVGPGDAVIVPAITFVSTAHAVKHTGADVVFCDVDTTGNICLAALHDMIVEDKHNYAAVIPVHYGGRMVDIAAIRSVLDDSVHIVEDCAHAAGAGKIHSMAGYLGDIGCFSFAGVKPMTTGDGGMITTDDPQIAAFCRQMSWCGIDKSTHDRVDGEKYSWQYQVTQIGYKYHMNDIQAAIGLIQLGRLQWRNTCCQMIAEIYNEVFTAMKLTEWITLPRPDKHSAWHLYPVVSDDRDALAVHLEEAGITTGVHYEPLYRHPIYLEEWIENDFPAAESLFGGLLSLPMHTELKLEEISYIADKIKEFYS